MERAAHFQAAGKPLLENIWKQVALSDCCNSRRESRDSGHFREPSDPSEQDSPLGGGVGADGDDLTVPPPAGRLWSESAFNYTFSLSASRRLLGFPDLDSDFVGLAGYGKNPAASVLTAPWVPTAASLCSDPPPPVAACHHRSGHGCPFSVLGGSSGPHAASHPPTRRCFTGFALRFACKATSIFLGLTLKETQDDG